jgi:hypothetical protein
MATLAEKSAPQCPSSLWRMLRELPRGYPTRRCDYSLPLTSAPMGGDLRGDFSRIQYKKFQMATSTAVGFHRFTFLAPQQRHACHIRGRPKWVHSRPTIGLSPLKVADNTASSWWRDPALRTNVFHWYAQISDYCAGLGHSHKSVSAAVSVSFTWYVASFPESRDRADRTKGCKRHGASASMKQLD